MMKIGNTRNFSITKSKYIGGRIKKNSRLNEKSQNFQLFWSKSRFPLCSFTCVSSCPILFPNTFSLPHHSLFSTLSHHSYTFSLSILFLYSLKIHGFTLSLLLNMTHPYEEAEGDEEAEETLRHVRVRCRCPIWNSYPLPMRW